jgi:hypothetical protein
METKYYVIASNRSKHKAYITREAPHKKISKLTRTGKRGRPPITRVVAIASSRAEALHLRSIVRATLKVIGTPRGRMR